MTSTAYKTFDGVVLQQTAAPQAWLFSSAPGVTVTGDNRGDQIADIAGGSTLVGGSGDDTYNVVDGKTKIVEKAGGGTDTVNSYTDFVLPQNVEIINALSPNVSIASNAQGGLLDAVAAKVKLVSGAGSDVMVDGGGGSDTFVFAKGSGHDAIYGFQASGAGRDMIQLQDFGFTTFAQVQSHLTQSGADTLLTLSSTDAVLIRNTQVSSLTADNFLLQLDTSHLKMTFDEEFNSLSLWNPATGTGIWKTNYQSGDQSGANVIDSHTLKPNGEQEVYVDPTFAGTGTTPLGLNPFSITNGVLSITASKTPTADLSVLGNYQYTSGVLTTEKSFGQTYGYFEIKAQMPGDVGAFPAFWLRPVNGQAKSEIDIFEHIDGATNVSQGYGSSAGGDHGSNWFSYVPTATSAFHTYGVLWTASTITWYVDGVATGQIATPADLNGPMYLITNLAEGGNWAGAGTFASTQFKVDYIHVFSVDQTPATVTAAAPAAVVAPVSDELDSAVTATLGATQHTLVLTGSAAINGTGNNLGDHLTGNAGANTLTGGTGADVIVGGGGADTMIGGKGDDSYYVDNVKDVVVENANEGHDTVYASVSYALPANVEDMVLTGTDNINATGNLLTNHITGNTGNNILSDGGGGGDTLVGGKGDDTYVVNDVHDVVIENPGEGNDTVMSSVTYTAPANVENLVLTGTAAINGTGNDLGDHLTGNAASNTLTGGAGNDVIDGGKGADIMIGGKGDDIYYVDNAGDQVIEKPNEGNDTVMSAITYTLPDNVENLVLLYTGDSSGNGNALDNHITGNDGNNILDGKAGNDVIDGGKGNDTLIGGAGDDTLTGGAGNDTFLFALWSGHDTITDFGANGDHDIIDVSAWLAKGYHPTVTDSASGLTLTFDAADSIHLLGVHPSQLITTAKGYTI